MINNEVNSYYYYFAVKFLSKLNSSAWLRGQIETMNSGDNDFGNALDDALDYQLLKQTHKEYQN